MGLLEGLPLVLLIRPRNSWPRNPGEDVVPGVVDRPRRRRRPAPRLTAGVIGRLQEIPARRRLSGQNTVAIVQAQQRIRNPVVVCKSCRITEFSLAMSLKSSTTLQSQ